MNIQHREYVNPADGQKIVSHRSHTPWPRKREREICSFKTETAFQGQWNAGGQWYFRPVIETSNEGGFGRTSEGWDFHETDTLSVVLDVPLQRRLRINIAENRLRNRTKAKRKVIPHCFCCFYRTNLCSADITQVQVQSFLHLRYIYINLTKEKSKMNKYG